MRRAGWSLLAFALLAFWAWQHAPRHARSAAQAPASSPAKQSPSSASQPSHADGEGARWPGYLPAEAIATLQRIASNGPFPYRQDGAVFQNRERQLPAQARGYYHEYTVATPGARDRGARRIISGGRPPREYFYSDDHYRSFRRFLPPP